MYQVSDAYKLKMMDQVQTHRLKGTLDTTINFTDSDVIGVSYSNQCSNKSINIGSVFVGTLKLTFLHDYLERGNYYGKVITLSDGLLLGYDDEDNPIWEDVPIGTFYISEATWRAEGMVDIVAYDCLSLMDKPCAINQSTGSLYSYCKWIETMTGAVFAMTEAECEALPNGLELVSPYVENEINTYRDLLYSLASFAGGFAYAQKDGTWKIRTYTSTSSVSIPKNRRISGAAFSDYTTYYDGISYIDLKTGVTRTLGTATASIIDLGANPFLQYGSVIAKTRRCQAIINAITLLRYTPFKVSMLPALVILDMGDVVLFTDDYTDDTTRGAVMSVAWTYNKSVTLQCFGDNPNMAVVKSQTSKSISSIRQASSGNEFTYYNFANMDALTFGSEEEVTIARLRFIASEPTTVKITHEFIFDMLADMSQNCSYELRYYLDGELLPYAPYERLNGFYGAESGETEFSITKDFFYVIQNIAAAYNHTWEVKIITHGVTSTTIDVNHAHITLEGQKMYGDEFGGTVEADDNLELISIGYVAPVALYEGDVKITWGMPSDNYILTEAGDYLCTESGDRLTLE